MSGDFVLMSGYFMKSDSQNYERMSSYLGRKYQFSQSICAGRAEQTVYTQIRYCNVQHLTLFATYPAVLDT